MRGSRAELPGGVACPQTPPTPHPALLPQSGSRTTAPGLPCATAAASWARHCSPRTLIGRRADRRGHGPIAAELRRRLPNDRRRGAGLRGGGSGRTPRAPWRPPPAPTRRTRRCGEPARTRPSANGTGAGAAGRVAPARCPSTAITAPQRGWGVGGRRSGGSRGAALAESGSSPVLSRCQRSVCVPRARAAAGPGWGGALGADPGVSAGCARVNPPSPPGRDRGCSEHRLQGPARCPEPSQPCPRVSAAFVYRPACSGSQSLITFGRF